MFLAQIILILQMALGLLANPQVQTNPAFKAQVLQFVNTAVTLSAQAMKDSSSTAEFPTSTVIVPPELPTSTVSQAPIYIYIPYAPTTTPASNASSTVLFGSGEPAPVVYHPVAPKVLLDNSGSSTATFKFLGGDYDSLKVNISKYDDKSQTYGDFVTYDLIGNPAVITGLTPNALYNCSLTVVKGTASITVISLQNYFKGLKDFNCGFVTQPNQ